MFHRDCYQVLLLNFRSSTETVSREVSQIDFAREVFFLCLGGYTRTILKSWQQSISQAEKETAGKSLSENFIREFYRQHKFRSNKSF